MSQSLISALSGGMLIGLATSLLLLTKGRIFGISGIIGGLIPPAHKDSFWRLVILSGLIAGGWLSAQFFGDGTAINPEAPWKTALAGLLVGFGTRVGGGCTSGHGVCGISRFSTRSILATCLFMTSGIITVSLTR